MKFIICLAFLVGVATASQVKFTDCGHNEAVSVDVSGCSGDYCVIYRGKSIKFSGDFIANQDSSTAEIRIFAKMNNVEVPFPGVEKDGCNHMKCPLHKGQKYHFDYDFVIPNMLPLLKSTLHAELVGEHGVIACVIIKGEVRNS